jgi:hypothetical protein
MCHAGQFNCHLTHSATYFTYFFFLLSFRQLPRITQDGLVEYSLQVPRSALSFANKGGSASNGGGPPQRGRSESPPPYHHHSQSKKYGADIDWILAGKPILLIKLWNHLVF